MTEPNPTDRKALLYRRANGKRVLASYLQKVAALFPEARPQDLLPLEVTDAVLARFNERRAELQERKQRIEPSRVRSFLSEAIKAYSNGFYAFIDEDWRYCGAVSVAASPSLPADFKFGEVVLNDVILIDPRMERATSLDFFEMEGRWLVDIIEWHQ